MNEKLEKVQDIFLEKISQLCREFGLNNIMAQLYAVLYFSNKPLPLNEMAERLKISKGSVSVNIRALQRYGVAKKVWFKGTRKDYYEAETDISRVIMDRVKSMTERRLSGIDGLMKSAYDALNTITPQDAEEKEVIEVFRQRLDKISKMQGKVHSLFGLLNSNLLNNVLGIKSGKSSKKEIAIGSSS